MSTTLKAVRKKPVQHELKLQHAIVDYLRYCGIFCWVTYQPLMGRGHFKMYHGSSRGVADILGIFNGRPLAIEVKRPGNKPTEVQKEFLQKFEKKGGIAFVAYSLDEVIGILALGKGGAR